MSNILDCYTKELETSELLSKSIEKFARFSHPKFSLASSLWVREDLVGNLLQFIRIKYIYISSILQYLSRIKIFNSNSDSKKTLLYFFIQICILHFIQPTAAQPEPKQQSTILSDENFTFTYNGSFIQLDAGKEWPFNSKREISFRFKTKSPHGLLIYQTFDHNKLIREEDQESPDLSPPPMPSLITKMKSAQTQVKSSPSLIYNEYSSDPYSFFLSRTTRSSYNKEMSARHLNSMNTHENLLTAEPPLKQLASNAITATASEKLVNSLFSASPAAAINGNNPPSRGSIASHLSPQEIPLIATEGTANIISQKDLGSTGRNSRVLNTMALNSESPNIHYNYANRANPVIGSGNDRSTILSSSTMSLFSSSLYELYLKLESGRLKIMYEYGSRLNQTYCGKGLNDDRWHKIDLKVDPEMNQIILVLDQMITVEIVLSQQTLDDDFMRRNDLVFTNSILYLGGLNNNASMVRNVRQRLYMAQFIGCIGQIVLRTDQHTDSSLQPAVVDKMVLVKRGCINRCDTNNYCLHKSTCINYYTHTKCDCFGTDYEDIYCWQDKLTTLSMMGYSTLGYRIYDWRDRHHSSINRISIQFKTVALDSILFFAYGDLLSNQLNSRNSISSSPPHAGTLIQVQPPYNSGTVNISSPLTIHRPVSHQVTSNSNYLAISLSNGTIVVEVSFGEQPILLSNLLYDKVYNRSKFHSTSETSSTSSIYGPLSLSDGRWHNVTFTHNGKHLSLHLDNYSVNYTVMGKNNHFYFDPTIYFGAIPNLLLNETRTLARPINLRHKFVGCLRSVYYNQHNILLNLKQSSSMVEYRDISGKARLDSCLVPEPNSLPLTLRSGKSYLTFQLTPYSQLAMLTSFQSENSSIIKADIDKSLGAKQSNSTLPPRKLTRIEFEFKTLLKSHFLAGGHLRDLSYHDLGGFWTLHAKENCQLYFTISSGLTFEPEQIIKINPNYTGCDPNSWFKISISMISGDKVLNITQSRVSTVNQFDDEYSDSSSESISAEIQSFNLKSSVELLHQVQLGGDLTKFGESSSVPFTGCIRRIKINGHLFDSRDFVTNSANMSPLTTNLNQHNASASTQSDVI